MPWYPKYKLYASDGITLVHQFEAVIADNSPSDPTRYTEVEGIRGQGSIIIAGSLQAWDLSLTIHLHAADYAALIAKMDSLESTIVPMTPYVLKIDRTISTTKDYNVKRISPISWDDSKRFSYINGVITFRVLSW
jgi:hypothetical protein